MQVLSEQLPALLQQVSGYIYPNEFELHWGLPVVIYPYLTGLVAGAFVMASLDRVFHVKAVEPAYRLALLTALSFLLIAPLPLLLHLGHPERSYEIFLTPNPHSAMAVFGFVYAWVLIAVVLLTIWFEYRQDLVMWSQQERGVKRLLHRVLTLGATDISERAVEFDRRAVHFISIVGIPSVLLLTGYAGFMFGSVKANPWWSSVLIPVVFLFSAIVSGIAMVLILNLVSGLLRQSLDMVCVDKLAKFLFFALAVDFSLEVLDFIHRLYESDESIHILSQLISTRLFFSLVILQALLGTLLPLIIIGSVAPVFSSRALIAVPQELRRLLYLGAAVLIQIGIFSMRWNVVIGGQLFSKSLRGFTVYEVPLFGLEGLLAGALLLALPFFLLYLLIQILPPWKEAGSHTGQPAASGD